MEKVSINLYDARNKLIRQTSVIPELPVKHNDIVTSVYVRVRVDGKRLTARIVPDYDTSTNEMYKNLTVVGTELQF